MTETTAFNPLYPVFLKLHTFSTLIVGAGEVGYEKLSFILKSSPDAKLTVVATWVNPDIYALLEEYPGHQVKLLKKAFDPSDIPGHQLVIAATNIKTLNAEIHQYAKQLGKLVNVADTPDLCDFYLGSIVTRGHLKVAISTNGQSPTFAKRFRQVLEDVLPEEASELLENLQAIRNNLSGSFSEKVKQLNEITASLLSSNSNQSNG